MSRIPLLALAAAVSLAACGDRGVTDAAPPPARSLSAATAACVTFDAPLPLWTWWGAPAHAPGTVVHVENGIPMTVEKFLFSGTSAYDRARVEPPPVVGFGTGQVAFMHYVDLGFDFGPLGWTPNHVRFQFEDVSLSTAENLVVNGAAHIGTIQAAPATLGGVSVTVAGGWVDLVGPVSKLRVGGRKFWIDELCAAP
jgi:hypothetical protein